MSQDVLINWKAECDAIHMEMDGLLTAGWPKTAEERQVRKIQFMALIERRNVAAQNWLKSAGTPARVSNNQQGPSETSGTLTNADPIFKVKTMNVVISQEPSEAPLAINRSSQMLPAEPMSEAGIMSIPQEPCEAAPAKDRTPHVPPDDPMFEFDVMNVQVFQESPEAALAIDRSPQVPTADLISGVEIMSGNISQDPPEAALAIDRRTQAPPANPMFEARNFLKFLGLK